MRVEGSGIAKIVHVPHRVKNHEVDVERYGDAPAYRLDHERTEGNIRHEIAVHDIAVDPVRTRILRFFYFALDAGEVCGKNRWGNFNVAHGSSGSLKLAAVIFRRARGKLRFVNGVEKIPFVATVSHHERSCDRLPRHYSEAALPG